MTAGRGSAGLAAPAGRVAVVLVVLALFVAFRWWARLEPLNSDDLRLLGFAQDFLSGEHWLRGAEPARAPGHAQLRIGILPVLVPAVAILGPGEYAYYLVPLLFAVLGFAASWALMHRHLDPRLALGFALFHAVHPFEVQHASLLLVDLPSAACLIASILLLGESSLRSPARLGWAVASGLFALEAYLLRENSLLLFAPAALVFLVRRRDRPAALVAGGVVALGIAGEQLLLAARGLGMGYRWQAAAEAVEGFGRFLPFYTPGEFLTRQLEFLWSSFGRGLDGAAAVALLLVALVALAAMLLVARSPTLQAMAACGLVAWALFAFGFSSWSGGRIHALAPPNFRYFQPFYYAAVVGLCWLCGRLFGARRDGGRPGDGGARERGARSPALACAAVLVLIGLRLSTAHLDGRLNDPDGRIARLLAALDRAAAAEAGPLEVASTASSARVLAMFRNQRTSPAVSWRLSMLPPLARSARRDGVAVLLDRPRVETDLRYGPPDRRERLGTVLAELQRRLCAGRRPVGSVEGVTIYAPAADSAVPGRRILLAPSRGRIDPREDHIRGWSLTERVDVEASRAGGVVLTPRRRPSDWYLTSGRDVDLAVPPETSPASRLSGGGAYALRVCLGDMDGIRAAAFLVQYDGERRLDTRRQRLWEGDNLLAFDAPPEAELFRAAIKLTATAGAGEARVVIHRIELLPIAAGDALAAIGGGGAGTGDRAARAPGLR